MNTPKNHIAFHAIINKLQQQRQVFLGGNDFLYYCTEDSVTYPFWCFKNPLDAMIYPLVLVLKNSSSVLIFVMCTCTLLVGS